MSALARPTKPTFTLSTLAFTFLTWARTLETEENRYTMASVFTTTQAIAWVEDVDAWVAISDELGFGPAGKRLIHEHRTGKWRLTALCDSLFR